MNKRILMLIGITICMFFSLFAPLHVNAANPGELEGTPASAPSQDEPAGTPASAPSQDEPAGTTGGEQGQEGTKAGTSDGGEQGQEGTKAGTSDGGEQGQEDTKAGTSDGEQGQEGTKAGTTGSEQGQDATKAGTTDGEQGQDATKAGTSDGEQEQDATKAGTSDGEQGQEGTKAGTIGGEQGQDATKAGTSDGEQGQDATKAGTTDGEQGQEATRAATPEIESGVIYDIQKAIVITRKVDEEGALLAGARLQIVDKSGKIWDDWVSDGESAHETLLPNGDYILMEIKTPDGYETAANQEFTVKIEIVNINADYYDSNDPCEHYGSPHYYVEIVSQSTGETTKHEVYCINQDWETPDGNSNYDGEILDPSDIRNFTQQTILIDAHQNKGKRDVSDQSLGKEELYDKILDIIYHRHQAVEDFNDLSEAEIKYVTELALKNYTNAGLTRVQRVKAADVPENYDAYDSYVTSSGTYVWYLYPWYRTFVYKRDAAIGESIVEENVGHGDAFGTLARHWSTGHNANGDPEVRKKVDRYYELYLYLIGDTNTSKHPTDMHLYIYSANNVRTDHISGNDYDQGAYQNLLGVTGYFEDIPQKKIELEMEDKYSTETVSYNVKKVWADDNNASNKRPTEITVILTANGKDYGQSIVLSEEKGWEGKFENLPVYIKGEKIEWSVREDENSIPEGYVSAVEYVDGKGFIVHNVYGQGGEEPPPDNPQTGDNIVLYLITLLLALIGFISGKSYLKRNELIIRN